MDKTTDIKGNILVVDDTPANLRLLSGMLTEQGYKVRSVISGPMALTATHNAPPDLILLDINMPDMNGYQVCEQLKADQQTCDIPIIFISALGETKDKIKAFTAGGVDYITKPFQVEEVLARVETHLSLRAAQRQLQAANRELERQVQELDAFAHTLAHDLKNPLTAMMGYAGLMLIEIDNLDSVPIDKLYQDAQRIISGGEKMRDIIESLLLLAGVRRQAVQYTPLDMAHIVEQVQARLEYIIGQCQAEIVTPSSWPTALGYAPWVEEIWANYISNALKYGGCPPHVELGFDLPTAGQTHIRFWVRDSGSGIAPQDQARLFTPFTRIQTGRAEGHGLGLSIVQRIAEKLSGQVGVESTLGQGSTFYFTLPAHQPDESE